MESVIVGQRLQNYSDVSGGSGVLGYGLKGRIRIIGVFRVAYDSVLDHKKEEISFPVYQIDIFG
jgi:hypothetical protein